jgi:DNA ligase (NAD+)
MNDVLSYVHRLDVPENNLIEPIPFITHCPLCGTELVTTDTGAFTMCVEPYCSGRVVGKLENYLIKLDIKGCKEGQIQKLVDAELIFYPCDFYTTDYSTFNDVIGPGNTENMHHAIFSKIPFDYELLAGMSIEGIGRTNSKAVCSIYTLKELISMSSEPTQLFKKIQDIEGFSSIRANDLINGIIENRDVLEILLSVVPNVKIYKDSLVKKTNDKTYTIVVTGEVTTWENRNVMKDELELLGHKFVGSVSSKTDFLVTNDPESGTTKNKKAKELGVQIVTEEQLREILGL